MSGLVVNGVRIHVEEHGAGEPILCVHGAGGSALAWAGAVGELERRGRVIVYDRRGCARSERPEPYERTSVREHAADAAALLAALDAAPAAVIGKSYGGTVALDLALRHPDRVRALALLEPDAPRELMPGALRLVDGLREHLRQVAARDGMAAVGEALVAEVGGEDAWRSFPEELRRVITGNGPAILAELGGEWWLEAEPTELAAIDQPTLIVAASDSPPEFRQASEALAEAIPNARLERVGGGHIIDPTDPAVLGFIEDVLAATRA
ncbi:MAG TPA: alpha/beta hydrolase [Solirubrobacterales bacterium]